MLTEAEPPDESQLDPIRDLTKEFLFTVACATHRSSGTLLKMKQTAATVSFPLPVSGTKERIAATARSGLPR
jgi:hypothetical protein